MRRLKRGGWAAILYTLRMANRVGWRRLWRAMSTRNACKTWVPGMGGQRGGMRNEAGHWPEVCKKSQQAMVADMRRGLEPEFFAPYSIDQLRTLSPRELEWCGRLTQPLYAGPGDTHYRVVGWEEALGRVAEQRPPGRQRADLFPGGQRPGAGGHRPRVEDARVQVCAGHRDAGRAAGAAGAAGGLEAT